MAKKSSLLAEVAKMPDRKSGKKSWIDRLQEKDPALFAEVIDLIDRHMAGEPEIRRKLPSEWEVARWLAPLVTERGHAVSTTTFTAIFRWRRGQRNGQS